MGTIEFNLRRRARRFNALNELHQKLRGLPLPQNWQSRPELIVELIEEANEKLPDYTITPVKGQGSLGFGQ